MSKEKKPEVKVTSDTNPEMAAAMEKHLNGEADPNAVANAAFTDATLECGEIGESLISRYHPHLTQAKIRYIFDLREDIQVKNGKSVIATARKATGLLNLFSGADFLIVIHGNTWSEKLTEQQQIAVIDHELCHCRREEAMWTLVGHDIEEFGCIVERYGFWRPDVIRFAHSIQKEFDFMKGEIRPRGV